MSNEDVIDREYILSEDQEYMNSEMLEYFKNKLLVWRDKLLAESAHEQELIADKTSREPDYVDEAVLEQDRSLDFFIADRDLNLIHQIEDALRRIEDSNYGYCEESGDEIGIGRLDAWPIARLTTEAQQRLERK